MPLAWLELRHVRRVQPSTYFLGSHSLSLHISHRLRPPPPPTANAGVINSAGDFVAVSSKDRKRAAAEAFLRRQLEDAERAARDAAAERARLATFSGTCQMTQ